METRASSLFFRVDSLIKRVTSFALSLSAAVLIAPGVSLAGPENADHFETISGGLANIESGAFVEGSVRTGGLQPDYSIDLSQEPFKSLLRDARGIGQMDIEYWDKVGMVVDLVRENFKYTNYYNPYYRRLMKKYREAKQDVPLHEYLACGAGVCREHAMVLHFALKAAGIPNRHGYATIYRASRWHGYEITEDHAFTVVKYKNTNWVVDAYYWGFNGFRLKDLLSPEGITENSPSAPIADPQAGTRRIVNMNAFPRIFNPKNARCEHVFQ